MKSKLFEKGFTVVELLIILVLLIGGATLFYTQKSQLDAAQHDERRKIAINAMYYNLEEVYYQKHSAYPPSIDSKVLRAMDPTLFIDPSGIRINDPASTYRYQGSGCSEGQCTGYTLRADLEKEADYIKTNRNK